MNAQGVTYKYEADFISKCTHSTITLEDRSYVDERLVVRDNPPEEAAQVGKYLPCCSVFLQALRP